MGMASKMADPLELPLNKPERNVHPNVCCCSLHVLLCSQIGILVTTPLSILRYLTHSRCSQEISHMLNELWDLTSPKHCGNIDILFWKWQRDGHERKLIGGFLHPTFLFFTKPGLYSSFPFIQLNITFRVNIKYLASSPQRHLDSLSPSTLSSVSYNKSGLRRHLLTILITSRWTLLFRTVLWSRRYYPSPYA